MTRVAASSRPRGSQVFWLPLLLVVAAGALVVALLGPAGNSSSLPSDVQVGTAAITPGFAADPNPGGPATSPTSPAVASGTSPTSSVATTAPSTTSTRAAVVGRRGTSPSGGRTSSTTAPTVTGPTVTGPASSSTSPRVRRTAARTTVVVPKTSIVIEDGRDGSSSSDSPSTDN